MDKNVTNNAVNLNKGMLQYLLSVFIRFLLLVDPD